MSQVNYVTKETFEKMQAELQEMKGVQRPAASKAKQNAEPARHTSENAPKAHHAIRQPDRQNLGNKKAMSQ